MAVASGEEHVPLEVVAVELVVWRLQEGVDGHARLDARDEHRLEHRAVCAKAGLATRSKKHAGMLTIVALEELVELVPGLLLLRVRREADGIAHQLVRPSGYASQERCAVSEGTGRPTSVPRLSAKR